VPTHVRHERLLLGAKGIEEVQGRLAVVALVVPLEENVERDGDLTRVLEGCAGDETSCEEAGCHDPRLEDR
jgi:hypothetical protein